MTVLVIVTRDVILILAGQLLVMQAMELVTAALMVGQALEAGINWSVVFGMSALAVGQALVGITSAVVNSISKQ